MKFNVWAVSVNDDDSAISRRIEMSKSFTPISDVKASSVLKFTFEFSSKLALTCDACHDMLKSIDAQTNSDRPIKV